MRGGLANFVRGGCLFVVADTGVFETEGLVEEDFFPLLLLLTIVVQEPPSSSIIPATVIPEPD